MSLKVIDGTTRTIRGFFMRNNGSACFCLILRLLLQERKIRRLKKKHTHTPGIIYEISPNLLRKESRKHTCTDLSIYKDTTKTEFMHCCVYYQHICTCEYSKYQGMWFIVSYIQVKYYCLCCQMHVKALKQKKKLCGVRSLFPSKLNTK